MKHTLLFKLERETKGALRYQEIERDGRPVSIDSPADVRMIGTLYVRKVAYPEETPKSLTVTVETT